MSTWPDVTTYPSRLDAALILGGASCLEADVEDWLAEWGGGPWDGLVIAINDVGIVVTSRLDHWVTLHAGKFPNWEALRGEKYPDVPTDYHKWGRPDAVGIAHSTEKVRGTGSSGMFATQIAITRLRCKRVVLCGVPMTRTPHFDKSVVHRVGRPWMEAESYWKNGWARYQDEFRGKVKSMSGRTRELLGAPTRRWVLGGGRRGGY